MRKKLTLRRRKLVSLDSETLSRPVGGGTDDTDCATCPQTCPNTCPQTCYNTCPASCETCYYTHCYDLCDVHVGGGGNTAFTKCKGQVGC